MFGVQILGRGTYQSGPTRTQPVIVRRQGRVLHTQITPWVVDRLVREAIMQVRVEVLPLSELPLSQQGSDGTTHVLQVPAIVAGAAMDS